MTLGLLPPPARQTRPDWRQNLFPTQSLIS